MSLLATRMQNFRANSDLDRWEVRNTQAGAFSLMYDDGQSGASIISPELMERARAAVGNTLEVPVIQLDDTVTIGNTATAVIADSELNSALYAITFTRYAFGFTVTPGQHTNNEIRVQKDFERKLQMYLRKFIDTVETASVAALEAAKTQVFNELLGIFTDTADVAVSSLAAEADFVGNLDSLMAGNDYYGGGLNIVGNQGLRSSVRNNVLNHGEFNETNERFQVADKTFYFSNKITNAVGEKNTCFAVQPGSTGIIPRFEQEVLLATQSPGGVRRTVDGKYEFGVAQLPILNIPIGTYSYEDVQDQSGLAGAATAGLTRAIVEHYGWCVDLAYVVAYNSDRATIPSGILKASVATT